MKVLKESVKEQKVVSLPRHSMRNPVANGVTVSPSAVSNGSGTTEAKSPPEEQDLGDKISPRSRQHSMRKSRASGEMEREVALSPVQSAAKLPTSTPLNPVTPLRWKSTKRLESEKRKLQEEIKTKEVVKEEKKTSKLAKDERKDQSKMATTKLGVNGIEDKRSNVSSASTSESLGVPTEESSRDQKHSHPVTNGGSSEHLNRCEEDSSFNVKRGDQTAGDTSGTDRKPLTGDESTAITIDFLRARLLAERASSKAAKECIQQLTKKVQELEGKLNQEIHSRRKAEEAAREALTKVESLNQCSVSSPSEDGPLPLPLPLNEKTKTDQQVQEALDQADEKCEVPAEVEGMRPNATVDTKPGHKQSTSLDFNDKNEHVVSEVEEIPTSGQQIGDHHGVQSTGVKDDGIPTVPRIVSANGDTNSPAESEYNRQERRFSTEARLQHMWNQIAAEMGALSEDNTIENRDREELRNWMRQVPSVVQSTLPKPSGDFVSSLTISDEKKLMIKSRTELSQLNGECANLEVDQALNSKEDEHSLDEDSHGDGGNINNKGLKKVATLIERFEANESTQREWEQSNAKQNPIGRRRSNESSLSRTNSIPGTPSSEELHQDHRLEAVADAPPKRVLQVEDLGCNPLATDSSVSPLKATTAEKLLISKENGAVRHTAGDSTPSTYPNSPVGGEMTRRSGGDGITPIITQSSVESSLEHTEFGLEGSMDTSFITTPRRSPSSGPSVEGNSGDISSNAVERSQILKQSNHLRALGGGCKTPDSHSERSSGYIGEPAQALIGWVNLEEAHTSPPLLNTGDHRLQRDALIRGRHLQQERLGPYSQAGNSNAYIRPGHYPVRQDEREIYRGRMESVSRSMEGLGGSWRSLSDAEGDETQMFADIPDPIDSRRSGPHISFQAHGGSGWSNYYQPENMDGTSQRSLYPFPDFPRESFGRRSESSTIESTSTKVNEVLKALQLAKLSIQKSGDRRATISNPCFSTNEKSYADGEKHSLKTEYGFSDSRLSNDTAAALRVWAHPEISRRYSTGTFRDTGSAPSPLQPSNSAPFGMSTSPLGKYHEGQYLTAGS